MSSFVKRLLILGAIVVVILGIWFLTPVGGLVDFQGFFDNRDALLGTVRNYYALSVLTYIVVYLAATALSIPGATVLTLLGGFFFGPWMATVWVNIGATSGAFVIFLAARYFMGEGVQQKYADKLARFNAEMESNGPNYLLTLRLIPIFPFFLVNLFAGFTTIKPRQFLWTTALGIIPGSFAYAWLGYAGATVGDGTPWQLFVALGMLAVLALVPVVVRKVKKARKGKEEADSPTSSKGD